VSPTLPEVRRIEMTVETPIQPATVADFKVGSFQDLMVEPIKHPERMFVATVWERKAAQQLFMAFEEKNFFAPETCDLFNLCTLFWPKKSGIQWAVASFPISFKDEFQAMALEKDLRIRNGTPNMLDPADMSLEAQFPLPDCDNVFTLEHKGGTMMLLIDPRPEASDDK
jgi:hypothetical protein